jgi:hypothetical protein
MCSRIESLDLLFFNDLDLNHPSTFLCSLSLSAQVFVDFFSLSFSLVLSVRHCCRIEKKNRNQRAPSYRGSNWLCGVVIQIHFDSFARGKNPLSVFVDNGKYDVNEMVTAIAVPHIQDNILIINSRDRN